jgi:hypothetical protein
VLERLNAEERSDVYGKVAVVAVVGNEAMNPRDYKDLAETPAAVDSVTKTLAAHAAHLARLLKSAPY